jgi:hypothetical protein
MHFKITAALVIGLLLMLPGRADASCCEKHNHAEASAIDMLLAMDPQFTPAPPVRQSLEVWFKHPTWIGKSIVQGHYVIEHDNDRMARGEPCTHIYAFDDRETPVVTFHCTHLERNRVSQPTVGLITTSEGMKKLTEFQFAGESAGHGYPVR